MTQVGVQVNKGTPQLSEEERQLIAEGWKKAALAEHASIASFSRFTLQLLHLGAPANLVSASITAANDEVKHTIMCLDMVHYWTGQKIGPSGLELANLSHDFDVSSIVYGTLSEGCIGETIAAEIAVRGVSLSEDDKTREILSQIAIEEQCHADLAWNFLHWASEKYNGLKEQIHDWFKLLEADTYKLKPKISEQDGLLCQYGIIKGQERHDIVFESFKNIISPRLKSIGAL